jgi:hypothetical protein
MESAREGKKILIVDDEPDVTLTFNVILQGVGYRANNRQFDALSKIITGKAGDNDLLRFMQVLQKNMKSQRKRVLDLKQKALEVI